MSITTSAATSQGPFLPTRIRLLIMVLLVAVTTLGCVTQERQANEIPDGVPVESDFLRVSVRDPVDTEIPIDSAENSPDLVNRSSGPLSVAEVLDSVDRAFPLLLAAEQKARHAEARYQQALGATDTRVRSSIDWQPLGFFSNTVADLVVAQPTLYRGLEGFAGWSIGEGSFNPTFDGKRQTNNGGEFRAGFALPLLRNSSIDELRQRLATGSIDIELADTEIQIKRLQFQRYAAVAYWAWVAAALRLEVADELLELARTRTTQITQRIVAGELADIERLDNQRVVREREAVWVSARRDLTKSEFALSLYLRDGTGSPLQPPEQRRPSSIPEFTVAIPELGAADLEQALEQHPELTALRTRLAREQVQLSYHQNQALPELNLSLQASQDVDGRRPSVTKGEFELVVGVSLDLPVQNRRARGKVAETEAKLAQLTHEIAYLEQQVKVDIRDARSALMAALERAQILQQAAELSEQLASAERTKFEVGDSNTFLVNQREQAAAEQRAKAISVLAQCWVEDAVYRYAQGLAPRQAEIAD